MEEKEDTNQILPEETEIKQKKKGQSRERMIELANMKREKALKKRAEQEELQMKLKEIENIKKEKVEQEY